MTSLLTMKERVELYLTHRQKLGYTRCAVETGLLKFADHVDQFGYKGPLTTSLATEWATASKKNNPSAWARRLEYIHGFAKYYKAIDPKTEIPPCNLYGSIYRRPQPYIYSKKEILDLFKASNNLRPIGGFKPIAFRCLLGLLACTGLRISEAIHLERKDVDLKSGILTIRETKCHKSRYVILHKTAKEALKKYVLMRDKKIPFPFASEFFINDKGYSFKLGQTEIDFRHLRASLGWKQCPRLYDFRHTFACQRLLKWYQEGKNISDMMIYLSAYLGHVRLTDTYWYLTATPELMSLVSKKFEKCSGLIKGNFNE